MANILSKQYYLMCDGKLSNDDELLLNKDVPYKELDWNKYDIPETPGIIVIRNCYNYYLNPSLFLEYLYELTSKGHILYNDVNLIQWNIDKIYLMELQSKGIKTVPTKLYHGNSTKWGEFIIVKDRISNGGHSVRKEWRYANISDTKNKLFQKYLSGVETEGEYSVIMIDGLISHTVHKTPTVGDFRVQHYFGGTYTLVDTPKEVIYTCEHLDWWLHNRFRNPLYLRLDFIKHEDEYYLSEVEAIEPLLHFELYPGAIKMFNTSVKYESNQLYYK